MSDRIGIIGTSTTIRSRAYEKEIRQISKRIRIVSQPCPLFVPLAEEGWLNGSITFDIAKKYLSPLAKEKIDTLVLGCTHYPLLKGVISRVVGERVKIVDSASAVAEDVQNILEGNNIMAKPSINVQHRFFATDAVEQFVKVGEKFLGRRLTKVKKVNYV